MAVSMQSCLSCYKQQCFLPQMFVIDVIESFFSILKPFTRSRNASLDQIFNCAKKVFLSKMAFLCTDSICFRASNVCHYGDKFLERITQFSDLGVQTRLLWWPILWYLVPNAGKTHGPLDQGNICKRKTILIHIPTHISALISQSRSLVLFNQVCRPMNTTTPLT